MFILKLYTYYNYTRFYCLYNVYNIRITTFVKWVQLWKTEGSLGYIIRVENNGEIPTLFILYFSVLTLVLNIKFRYTYIRDKILCRDAFNVLISCTLKNLK